MAARAAAAGDELFISYGRLSPAALLAHYGIPPSSPTAAAGNASAGGGAFRPVDVVWRGADGTALRRRRVRLPGSFAGSAMRTTVEIGDK